MGKQKTENFQSYSLNSSYAIKEVSLILMSQSTKRKHVTKELLDDNFELPKENQKIVRIVAGRGNNLHQVIEADEKTTYLVSMPNKFRKNVWVKRGNYCIVEPIEEGDKVKAEIVRILYKDQIRTKRTIPRSANLIASCQIIFKHVYRTSCSSHFRSWSPTTFFCHTFSPHSQKII